MKKSTCAVPLNELKSAPAIDLIQQDGKTMDRDSVIDLIRSGGDSSQLQPQASDLYTGNELSLIEYNTRFPSDEEALKHPLKFISSTEADHLTQARVVDPLDPDRAFKLSVTYDLNAAIARNALLRKLGYNIPSPKLYRKLSIQFENLETRDNFLIRIAKMRDLGLWVDGGKDELDKKNTTITLINVALESALLMNIPPLHWGIFTQEILQSRRSLRSLLIPLTLLDIDESVNMYSFEPAKIENDQMVFSRVYAKSFKNETSIGDARWIARKISKLTRNDWIKIIRAGQYPADIEALIIEKTIGRVNQLMKLLQISDFKEIPYQSRLTYGQVIHGKAYQSRYEGYPHFFAYGDPLDPLRFSEIVRYFSVEIISNAIKFVLDQGNRYLQLLTQEQYIQKHAEKFKADLIEFAQNHPGQPYIQPIETWGGPILGGGVSANRSVIAGTYYGSESPIQLVDSLSVNARVGYFLGVSGIKNLGIGITPSLGYSRNYVHVRPIADMKAALKDNWGNLAVPFKMAKLSKALLPDEGEDQSKTIEDFLSQLKTGEMFIIIDGFTLANQTQVGIPLGAMLGFSAPLTNLAESIGITNQYAILNRTTIYKSEEGLHVYLSDIKNKGNGLTADTEFFIKLLSVSGYRIRGEAQTKAFIFPKQFKQEDERTHFIDGMKALLRLNNSDQIEQHFQSYSLNHDSKGGRRFLRFGPWQWTRREILNKLEITPPVDPEGKYQASEHKRIVIQGQINRIRGSDYFGFLGNIANRFLSFLNLGANSRGDDPSTNFLGKSTATIVSSEIETTPGRSNNTLVRIQQSHNGWSMKKKKILKLIESIQTELGELEPPGNLIDQDSFSQTKKIEAYNLIWNLSIYESGIQKLSKILDQKRMGTVEVANHLISLEDSKTFRKFCDSAGRTIGYTKGPVWLDDFSNMAIETVQGQTIVMTCATPWMQSVFDLRNRLSKKSAFFMDEVRNETDASKKIQFLNQTFVHLEKSMDLGILIRLIGSENSYFQLSVAGYRKGDERAQDEEGRSSYFSNTIGQLNPIIRNGPLEEISKSSTILQHEISARYLSDGY